ncbi:hypothetical protein ENBRE01_1601 [Enteropsectra breve]|nr:hypothetical protein ENBRE01_1601 [Enteropsectra breve]
MVGVFTEQRYRDFVHHLSKHGNDFELMARDMNLQGINKEEYHMLYKKHRKRFMANIRQQHGKGKIRRIINLEQGADGFYKAILETQMNGPKSILSRLDMHDPFIPWVLKEREYYLKQQLVHVYRIYDILERCEVIQQGLTDDQSFIKESIASNELRSGLNQAVKKTESSECKDPIIKDTSNEIKSQKSKFIRELECNSPKIEEECYNKRLVKVVIENKLEREDQSRVSLNYVVPEKLEERANDRQHQKISAQNIKERKDETILLGNKMQCGTNNIFSPPKRPIDENASYQHVSAKKGFKKEQVSKETAEHLVGPATTQLVHLVKKRGNTNVIGPYNIDQKRFKAILKNTRMSKENNT